MEKTKRWKRKITPGEGDERLRGGGGKKKTERKPMEKREALRTRRPHRGKGGPKMEKRGSKDPGRGKKEDATVGYRSV